ncbi:MAG: 16S rRNA (cytosine(1402)-N(4))-methyltransferase RsmH [Pyrinomonadaceae bacterium]
MSDHAHIPVLLDETLEFLSKIKDGTVVDATLGFGGHSFEILARFPNIKLVAFDQDEVAIKLAVERLTPFENRVELIHANFSDIERELTSRSITDVRAIIADLGVSSMQFDSETRGFSFRFDAPLDMRMDVSLETETAADILANRSEFKIADIIYRFGEERFSRRIARRIVEERNAGRPIETTKQLADLVSRSVRRGKRDAIHPATKTFQALRIAVNRELENLESFMTGAMNVLATDGILAIITFHSLEDRIVKNAFQRFAGKCICPPKAPQCVCGAKKIAEILTKKPIVPTAEEIDRNWRSRSAKLRAVRKIEN